jgi:hypothetical protein
MSEGDTCGTYVFHVDQLKNVADLRNAVVFARQQLLQEVGKKGFNVLLSEGSVLSSTELTMPITSDLAGI